MSSASSSRKLKIKVSKEVKDKLKAQIAARQNLNSTAVEKIQDLSMSSDTSGWYQPKSRNLNKTHNQIITNDLVDEFKAEEEILHDIDDDEVKISSPIQEKSFLDLINRHLLQTQERRDSNPVLTEDSTFPLCKSPRSAKSSATNTIC